MTAVNADLHTHTQTHAHTHTHIYVFIKSKNAINDFSLSELFFQT